MRQIVSSIIGVMALGLGPAAAQDLLDPHPLAGVVDELRIGIHAYNVHYAMLPTYINEWQFNEVSSVSFDVLFTSPQIDAFTWIGSPRPEIGATINLAGKENLVHAGLTWQLPIFDTPVFLEGTFGAAIHDGALNDAPAGEKNFGCRVNFYERFGIGVNASETMTATLAYEHTSNNDWCSHNAGLSNFGLRIGWKF